MSLRSMTFVTTRPNRCKHLWLSLLQKLIIMISFTGCGAVSCRGRPPCLPEQLTQIPIIGGQTRGSAPTVGCNAIRMANSKL